MTPVTLDQDVFKKMLKEVLTETLREQRDLLHEVFTDALEDFALAEAIREGRKTKIIPEEEVDRILRGES